MVKNTNKIRIVLQSKDPAIDVDVNDFTFTFSARNNSYGYKNDVADNVVRTYVPFFAENDAEAGAVVELATLRLLAANDNRLLIEYAVQNQPIIDENLNAYINVLKLSEYGSMGLQEFMDREDEYKVIVSLTKGGGANTYISSEIQIVPWNQRGQGEDDLSRN